MLEVEGPATLSIHELPHFADSLWLTHFAEIIYREAQVFFSRKNNLNGLPAAVHICRAPNLVALDDLAEAAFKNPDVENALHIYRNAFVIQGGYTRQVVFVKIEFLLSD